MAGRDGITVRRSRAGPAPVIRLNDDYTPREFVVTVLKGEFRMSEDQAYRVMMTAHRRGVCVVAVCKCFHNGG
jgi:ATP-dependent Clp protease adaptor protein ClpS